MIKTVLGLLLVSPSLFAQYTNVYLGVAAPAEWQKQIINDLKIKLNAIPDVQVVENADDAAFTISVDVNAVTNGKDELIGYSMMTLIYGTYDRAILTTMFDTLWKDSKDKSVQQMLQFLKYTISGNIFLAGTVHTHGPVDDIGIAYDQIVGTLKTKALPELRRFGKMLGDLPDNTPRKPLTTSRY